MIRSLWKTLLAVAAVAVAANCATGRAADDTSEEK
jgi:hypothetical protein